MALWKEQVKPDNSSATEAMDLSRFETLAASQAATPAPAAARQNVREKSLAESLIAPDITIEGKIEGSGHVRIAGRFKGDVDVHGDLTIESGATLTGSVRAEKVTIAGELIGNIESASHVELLQSGALNGDVKAATLTVSAGSRMRGQVEFGWGDVKSSDAPRRNGTHTATHTNGHGLVS